MSFDVQAVQKDLKAAKLDGWLFYDFRGRDPIAHRILHLPPTMRTRRWFYFIPTKGAPRKLVHKIESESLAALPGETLYYAAQSELQENLAKLVGDAQSIAMQYSARNAIPYVSMVDAGTVELVRSVGPKIFSSADLVQKYEACWTAEQLESHLAAGEAEGRIIRDALQAARNGTREGKPLTGFELKHGILAEVYATCVTTEARPDRADSAH